MDYIQECTKRIEELGVQFTKKGSTIQFVRFGKCTTLAMVTDSDGWETVGVAYTNDPEHFNFTIGSRWALEDAATKWGMGRFFDGTDLGK